ncbi:hypothetical protein D3C80_1267970 [compost metagenome]
MIGGGEPRFGVDRVGRGPGSVGQGGVGACEGGAFRRADENEPIQGLVARCVAPDVERMTGRLQGVVLVEDVPSLRHGAGQEHRLFHLLMTLDQVRLEGAKAPKKGAASIIGPAREDARQAVITGALVAENANLLARRGGDQGSDHRLHGIGGRPCEGASGRKHGGGPQRTRGVQGGRRDESWRRRTGKCGRTHGLNSRATSTDRRAAAMRLRDQDAAGREGALRGPMPAKGCI